MPRFSLFLAALVVSGASRLPAETVPAYLDPQLSQPTRIHDLITRMTLEEKVSMMANGTPGVARLGIPKYNWWSEGLHGVANAGEATVFPQAIGMAAMWDPALHHNIGQTVGIEGRAKFNSYAGTPLEGAIFRGLTFWSPNINIFRDPRWGRGQETYGEDPFLTARLGVAFVRGLQGDNSKYLLAAACAKHFAVHSGPESLRHDFDISPPEADLHETYLPAFESLVREAHVEVVMTAYNSIYGTPCSIHPMLYSLLDQWGFNGHVTSDCGSVTDLRQTYKRACCDGAAQALTLNAGMNVRCGDEPTLLVAAVHDDLITEAMIDRRLEPLLRTMFRLGFFDPKDKVPFNKIPIKDNDSAEHGALALAAARESLVLLKNDGVLPLNAKKLHRIAVIGPNASSVPALVGNYNGSPSAPVTVLAGLKAALEPLGVQVDYVHGCDFAPRPSAPRSPSAGWFQGDYFANSTFSDAPAVHRWVRPLSFDFANPTQPGGEKPAELPETGISARWTGDLNTTLSGDYRLIVRGRGGFRLSLGADIVIDALTPPPGEEGKEREISVLRHLGDNATLPLKLEYVQGVGPAKVVFEWQPPAVDIEVTHALEAAKAADAVIFVGGITAQLEGEEMHVDYDGFVGGDRSSIELPTTQRDLLEKLSATGKPVVLVNLSGSAIALPSEDAKLNAILQAWYPGQAGGTAVADVVLGNYNPAGRLPVTFYRATSDLPDFQDYAMAGRTYRYFAGKALYPFGHGLSYTNFKYSKALATKSATGEISVSVAVSNTGERDGDEVIQVYAKPPQSSHPRELRALCGFDRIHLKAGETRTVLVPIPASALRRWNNDDKAYATPSGDWAFEVGASSADIRETTTLRF